MQIALFTEQELTTFARIGGWLQTTRQPSGLAQHNPDNPFFIMTDVNKINTVYGQTVAVKIIRDLNNSRIVENANINIYPIVMKDFKEAAEAYDKDDMAAFIKFCAPFVDINTLESLDPASFLDLYDKCVELNQNGFFKFLARQEQKEQARTEKNLKLLEQTGLSEEQKAQMITELAKEKLAQKSSV